MAHQQDLRDRFRSTIAHLHRINTAIHANTAGRGRVFTYADHHKLAEGIFMSAWTDWEEFIKALLLADVATTPGTCLTNEVRQFRTRGAHWRLADLIINHPDSPESFVPWDYDMVKDRANRFLPNGHRFVALAVSGEIKKMKTIRNAVAHGSDKAWHSFRKMVKAAPFNFTSGQMRFLTVGRFLVATNWNGSKALTTALNTLDTAARQLVP